MSVTFKQRFLSRNLQRLSRTTAISLPPPAFKCAAPSKMPTRSASEAHRPGRQDGGATTDADSLSWPLLRPETAAVAGSAAAMLPLPGITRASPSNMAVLRTFMAQGPTSDDGRPTKAADSVSACTKHPGTAVILTSTATISAPRPLGCPKLYEVTLSGPRKPNGALVTTVARRALQILSHRLQHSRKRYRSKAPLHVCPHGPRSFDHRRHESPTSTISTARGQRACYF